MPASTTRRRSTAPSIDCATRDSSSERTTAGGSRTRCCGPTSPSWTRPDGSAALPAARPGALDRRAHRRARAIERARLDPLEASLELADPVPEAAVCDLELEHVGAMR